MRTSPATTENPLPCSPARAVTTGGIRQTLESMSECTVEIVTHAMVSYEEAEKGKTSVQQVTETFSDLSGTVDKFSQQMHHVTSITQELATDIEHVNDFLNEVSHISEEFADKAKKVSSETSNEIMEMREITKILRELAHKSENLTHYVEDLNHTVKQEYILEQTDAASSPKSA